MNDVIDFGDLQPTVIPVKYGGKLYFLTEASVGAAVAFRNATTRAARVLDNKVQGFDGLADAEPILISKCLYAEKDGKLPVNPDGTPDSQYLVPLEVLMRWPNQVQRRLFDKVREVSPGLIDRVDPKAQPSSTTQS